MNDIRAFFGLRYDEAVAGPMGELLSPPYDVVSPPQQAAFHEMSPFNVIRLELGLEYPTDGPRDNRYTRAADTLERWIDNKVLKVDEEPSLYVYEQRFRQGDATLSRMGVFASLRLTDWSEGVVLPHEHTLSGPKVDRLKLMQATKANMSPLYLLFDDPTGLAGRMIAEATCRIADAAAETGDGMIHRLWVIQGDDANVLQEALSTPQLYMADGHHRYETALTYRDERRAADGAGANPDAEYNFALVLLVDAEDSGLVVLPTHRMVRGVTVERLVTMDSALVSEFEIQEVERGTDAEATAAALLARIEEAGEDRVAIALYRPTPWKPAVLLFREPPKETVPGERPVLDVDVLHKNVLEERLGIGAEELKAGSHVSYTRDAAEAVSAVDSGEAQAAFLLNPTRVSQVLETARAGGKMPQKSTYFDPKPATGLVIKQL